MKMLFPAAFLVALAASGCASVEADASSEAAARKDNSEYVTGSRIPQRGNAQGAKVINAPDPNAREELFGNKAGAGLKGS